MAVPIIPSDGTITISDATAITPVSMTIQYEDGDFSLSGLKAGQREVTTFTDRGTVYAARETSESPPTFSFSCHVVGDLTNATQTTILDAILGTGAWSAAVSTFGGISEARDVTWSYDATAYGGEAGSVALKGCALSADISEGEPGKISISGTCYGDGAGAYYTIS